MHEDLLERRLRSALHDAAAQLSFTITAAELERRAVLRGRGVGNRRLALLLAAAVGVGLVGVGGVIGGLVQRPTDATPRPTTPAIVTNPSIPPNVVPPSAESSESPRELPSLDEVIAERPVGTVALAQSHGPAEGPDVLESGTWTGPASVTVGALSGSTRYQIAFGCRGEASGSAVLNLDVVGVDGTHSSPIQITRTMSRCDGSMARQEVDAPSFRVLTVVTDGPASWRVVVRRLDGAGGPQVLEPPTFESAEGEEELVRADVMSIDGVGQSPDANGFVRQQVGAIAGRERYRVQLWCTGGDAIRYLHSGSGSAVFVPSSETQVPCDARPSFILLDLPEPGGSEVFIAATPETRWSVLVTSDQPPVSLVRDMSGWQLAGGSGPDFAFETHGSSVSSQGVEGGGPLLVALECAGTAGPIEVQVDFDAPLGDDFETFTAECAPDGARTAMTFQGELFIVAYTARAGTWTALSILVPDPLPERGQPD